MLGIIHMSYVTCPCGPCGPCGCDSNIPADFFWHLLTRTGGRTPCWRFLQLADQGARKRARRAVVLEMSEMSFCLKLEKKTKGPGN